VLPPRVNPYMSAHRQKLTLWLSPTLGWRLILLCLVAIVASARAGQQHQQIKIAAGPAAETLPKLIEQTDIELIYRPDSLDSIRTREINGRWRPGDALSRMLEGTPLRAVPDSASGAVAVIHREIPLRSKGQQLVRVASLDQKSPSEQNRAGSSNQAKAAWWDESESSPKRALTISPFRVHGDRDRGYTASSSLASGRMDIKIEDSSASIAVLTKDFLEDIAANSFIDAADWSTNANSQYTADGPQIFNDYIVNVRSMGSGFQSRNYFRWYVNSDTYNTNRIDFARGPNSIIFGDSGVGGIANVSSIRALSADTNELTVRWNSFGGIRTSFDVNRALTDSFAIRAALLWDRSKDWVDASRNDREGAFITATYQLSPQTKLIGEIELGSIDRVVGFSPVDGFSHWDGATLVDAPISGDIGGTGIEPFTEDYLVYVPRAPGLGIRNWRQFGSTRGTGHQLLSHSDGDIPSIDRLSRSYQSPDAVVHQPYGVGALFVEHEISENLFLEFAGNYVEQHRDIPQNFGSQVFREINTVFPDGTPNPNLGRRYVEDRRRSSDLSNQVYEYRFSAAYNWEVESWLHQRLLLSAGQRWDRFEMSRFELVRTNGTNPNLTDISNRIRVRNYVEGPKPSLALPPVRDPISDIESRNVRLQGVYNDNELNYIQAAASGSWFSGQQLRTILAARKDFLRIERAASRVDPLTQEWVGYTGEINDPDLEITTVTAGIVYKFAETPFRFFANYAESFQPANAAFTIDGSGVPSLRSEGIDFGLRYVLPDSRLSASLSYYTSKETDRPVGGSSTDINEIWTLLGSNQNVPLSYSDTFSQKGSGWEFDLTANPTPNWRVFLNAALPTTEQQGGYAFTRSYYEANIPEWMQAVHSDLSAGQAAEVLDRIDLIRTRIASFQDGRRLDGTYRYTANFFTHYAFENRFLDGFGLGFGIQTRGERLITNRPGDPFDYIYVDAFTLLTGSISYRFKVWDNPLRLQLNVSNLLDQELVQPTRFNVHTTSAGEDFVADRFFVQPPRRFTVTLRYSY
jgi:hypothetical protein